ncbi:hypothetical protein BH11PSE8_BH11PSE8_20600 [soil metagenome]
MVDFTSSATAKRRSSAVPARLAFITAFGFLWLAGAVQAQTHDEALDKAAMLLERNDPAAAYAALEGQEVQRAGDPRYDYLLGIAALDSGHLTRAIFALERLLTVQPANHPARAELARAYLAAGESGSARVELAQVRHADLPPAAAAAIDRVLGALDKVAPPGGPKASAYLELGGGRDGNVNSATNAGQFAIPAFGGLLFTVAPGNRRQHDLFGFAAGGASVQWALDDAWKLLASANVRATANRRLHDMNTVVADGRVGLSHGQGTNVQTVALESTGAWVSSRIYRSANGASAQWQSQVDPVSQLSAFAQWSRQHYSGQAERDTDRTVLGGAYARNLGAQAVAYGSAYLADERARAGEFAYHGHRAAGLRLGGEYRLGDATVTFFEAQHERRRYGGQEPLFDARRQDRQTDLVGGVRYTPAPQWQLLPQVRYTRAESGVVLYDYTRLVFQISVRRDFQ